MAFADSNLFSITIAAVTEPAWRVGQDVNEWVEILGSALEDSPPSVNPNSRPLASTLEAWCGLSIDTRSGRIWSLANGGHDDSHENGVRYLPLGVDSPTWVEVLASSDAAGVDSPNDAAYYPDGRPCSSHTYYTQQFIEARNRAIRFGVGSSATVGNPYPNVDGFDCTVGIGVNGWDAAGTYPSLPSPDGTDWAICKNPTTEDVYYFNANYTVQKWTQTSNTWTQINGAPPGTSVGAASAYDTTRNRILLVRGDADYPSYCVTYDTGTNLFTSRTLTGAAAAPIMAAHVGAGMVYVPSLDSYFVRLRAAGGAIYVIDASTFAVTSLSTTGGGSIPITAAISGDPENVFGKFLYYPALGGVAYIPTYASNCWFLRLY
jgi:hypothetical protein